MGDIWATRPMASRFWRIRTSQHESLLKVPTGCLMNSAAQALVGFAEVYKCSLKTKAAVIEECIFEAGKLLPDTPCIWVQRRGDKAFGQMHRRHNQARGLGTRAASHKTTASGCEERRSDKISSMGRSSTSCEIGKLPHGER